MNLLTGLSWVWTTETEQPASTHGSTGTTNIEDHHRFTPTDGVTDTYTEHWAGASQRG